MGRILIIVLLVLVAVWLIRRAFARPRQDDRPVDGPARVGELVRCARCGVHLPSAEARRVEGVPYCSEEHARLGPGEGD